MLSGSFTTKLPMATVVRRYFDRSKNTLATSRRLSRFLSIIVVSLYTTLMVVSIPMKVALPPLPGFLVSSSPSGGKVIGFYIIVAGLLMIALFRLIVAYREDHPQKPWKQ